MAWDFESYPSLFPPTLDYSQLTVFIRLTLLMSFADYGIK